MSLLLSPLVLLVLFFSISLQTCQANSQCIKGCDLALANYYVWEGLTTAFLSQLFSIPVSTINSWNPVNSPDQYIVQAKTRINIPFTCDCINGDFLAHIFSYNVSQGDTYDLIANTYYSNLTSSTGLQRWNRYPGNAIPVNSVLNVTVNCSCGDKAISKDYGLFVTWPIRDGDTLDSVAAANNLSADVVRRYNPTASFNEEGHQLFIPGKDESGSYRPLSSGSGLSAGAIAGISVAVPGLLFFAACLYFVVDRTRKAHKISPKVQFKRAASSKASNSVGVTKGASPGLAGIVVEKSVEFSYEELATATNDFSLANKIGEGGFGSVYYAELRGEKAAIKKMDLKATREFLAELRVLTRVHHQNLVRLIGYCVEGSLFLVYEYVENGNLSQHLRGSGRDTLSWSTRVQIAVDSARGLEYIHEHTIPPYVHRDIKSANILIDNDLHAKVADFGLTKLAEVGGPSLHSRLVGTFGYMAPEYANRGTVSPKVDVYAFGVMLYELISAKAAIVDGGSATGPKGLVTLFEQVLPDPNDDLRHLVDPRLGDNYPLKSVRKMFQLAKLCTLKKPQLRPSMKSVIITLMTLSSSIEESMIGSSSGK
ncbi:lysM domain receptor-like kinase 3 [Coffea eugenioides]|uniref:lysM domain receptor-like kinase 3 n=1 Tax=Coffea eugenioides TaxID=49369 RepID=UPI000F60FBA2|nr:lysM domain receptor-like kinase 3 [Coffea eugenioides]